MQTATLATMHNENTDVVQLTKYSLPNWFTDNHIHMLHMQPDQDRLIAMAERIWPNIDWIPDNITNRNRAIWYIAVIRQRSTTGGWILDQDSAIPTWGHTRAIGRACTGCCQVVH